MLNTLKLLLPVLIPSWRFFDVIAPSPRIEFRQLTSLASEEPDKTHHWQEFRPRPAQLSIFSMLKRMFWNASWNESLFLVSCAERLMANPSQHSYQEIAKRIKLELQSGGVDITATPFMQFRLVFLSKDNQELSRHITYLSKIEPINSIL